MQTKFFFRPLIFLTVIFLSAEAYAITENLIRKSTYFDFYCDSSNNYGVEFSTPAGNFRTAQNKDSVNFGLNLSTVKVTSPFSVTLKTGNLSAGGIISKMNNPLLSATSSPFSTSFSSSSAITANLPGFTSFSKPLSFFFELDWNKKKSIITEISLNSLFIPDDDVLAFSISSSLPLFNNNLKMTQSYCAGFFPYQKSEFSTWFSKKNYYHAGNHFCSFYDIKLTFHNLTSDFSWGLYETPFGSLSDVYRIDNKLITKHFQFNLSLFYNDKTGLDSIITSSDKKIDDCFQFQWGIQYKYTAGIKTPVFIKTGFMNFCDIKLSQFEHPLKFCGGIQISNSVLATTLTAYINTTDDSSNKTSQSVIFNSGGFQLRASIYTRKFTPSLTLSGTLKNSTADIISTSWKINGDILFRTIKGNFSYGFNCKNNSITDKKITGTIVTNLKFKNFRMTFKLSGQFEM